MIASPITHAVVVAAGNGSRLKRHKGDSTPKPLRKILGLSLLERILRSAEAAGIRSATVVVGYQADKIRAAAAKLDIGLDLDVVENAEWRKQNGVSILTARKSVGNRQFALLMADHLFAPEALKAALLEPLSAGQVRLAVDSRIEEIDDLDDATKVQVDASRGTICAIGKTLPDYNAIDTGIFCCTPQLFDILEDLYREKGDCSISDGMRMLAAQGKLLAFTFPANRYWQDVDTPEAFKIAEKKLLRACIKPTDGFISRNFNRRISLGISRWLVKTPLTCNTVTGFVTLVGVLSGVFAARGGYWGFLIGAILFKSASILDGCDGEMARLRFAGTKLGQWLDTTSDNLSYIAFFIGMMVGMSRQGAPLFFPYMVGATIFGVGMTLFLMFNYMLRYTSSGSLVSIQADVERDRGLKLGFLKTIGDRISFMIKRDFFSVLFLLLAAMGKGSWIFYTVLVGSNLAWMFFLSMIRRPAFDSGFEPTAAPKQRETQ